MDKQTQKTILISLIVALVTTVPFAIIVSLLTMQFLFADDSASFNTSLLSQVVDQTKQAVETDNEITALQNSTLDPLSQTETEFLKPNTQTSQTEAGRLAITRTIFTTDKAVYTLQSTVTQNTGAPYRKQSILRADSLSGEETVWIDDIKTLDTTGTIKTNEEFSIFSNPKQGQELYLEIIPGGGTELIGMDVYRFSLASKTLVKLAISTQLRNNFGAYAIAPNGTMLVLVPPKSEIGLDQDLYLLDLANDSSKRLFSLTENETFNAGASGLLVYTNMKWIDNENFTYSVYDQSLKSLNPDLSVEGIDAVFLEDRSYSLNVK